jgi:hypothetical protein
MNTTNHTAIVGTLGLIANITLEQVNTMVAIFVGLATITYLGVKIIKELKK